MGQQTWISKAAIERVGESREETWEVNVGHKLLNTRKTIHMGGGEN